MAETLVLAVIVVSLAVYALTGGADFGGGVWDLFASGPRAKEQRALIAHAIGPIWEANHIWLILVVVLLFVAFPVAFAAIGTALHVPLTLMLFGVVLRGSAFVFRAMAPPDDEIRKRMGLVFAIGSIVAPWMLGTSLGTVLSGALRLGADGRVVVGAFSAWMAPFPLVSGAFVLSLFAWLAASYLAVEAETEALKGDFRKRAVGGGVVAGILGLTALFLAREGAPLLWARSGGVVFQGVVATVALGSVAASWGARDRLARALAAATTLLVVGGWAGAQHPYVLPPDLAVPGVGAPEGVLWATLGVLAVGSVVLVPAFWWLYRVFKGTVLSSR